MRDITFPSRMDRWLTVLSLTPVPGVAGHAVLLYPTSPALSILDLYVLLAMVLLVALVGYPCTFTLT